MHSKFLQNFLCLATLFSALACGQMNENTSISKRQTRSTPTPKPGPVPTPRPRPAPTPPSTVPSCLVTKYAVFIPGLLYDTEDECKQSAGGRRCIKVCTSYHPNYRQP